MGPGLPVPAGRQGLRFAPESHRLRAGRGLKVFFSAPLVSRIRRVAQRQNITEGEAKATVQKNEKLRADNYRYYTRRMWGAAGNFDLSLNTDLGEEFIENCIRSAMKL